MSDGPLIIPVATAAATATATAAATATATAAATATATAAAAGADPPAEVRRLRAELAELGDEHWLSRWRLDPSPEDAPFVATMLAHRLHALTARRC